ncbi:class I SAM-dependent methyltransferase [Pseudomonas fluorescens]|uniref:class I SAM-dependent methyltransferase n=1 Tax=Pseudomonas fluorescens TaxID=294 RepID=UPI001BE979F7|nr:class I SAM-dependent methyltransferase [Pseudomonas fluorescens]MBT2372921.1 methyltransferase domain-containing protein [Pseudomonas fluorescens]
MDRLSAKQAISSNKDAWNESAKYHKGTANWQALLDSVGSAGFSRLDPTLTALLLDVGVKGKDVVQLGCNNGRESLSLFGLGAIAVVGVDQSEAFVQQARELAQGSPHSPEFIEADIHQLPEELHSRFDLALITIGVLNWMPDIGLFMAHVARTLKPGGTLVIYETHPYLEMFDPQAVNPMLPVSSYFQREPFIQQEAIVYEGEAACTTAPSYWFVHTMGDIVGGILAAGLQVNHLKEYPHSNREDLYDQYEHQPAQLPLCYTLTAIKCST